MDKYIKIIEKWFDLEIYNKDKTVMLEWSWIGEGLSGDWQEDDPDDYPHLRFTIYEKLYTEDYPAGEFFQIDDSSYCTSISIDTSKKNLEKLAHYILNIVENRVKGGRSIKKLCEELSWIDEGVLNLPELK